MTGVATKAPARALVVCAGPRAWCAEQASAWALGAGRVLWLSDLLAAPAGAQAPRVLAQMLGSEFDLIVMDAMDGLPPDRLAAAAGTLCAGGTLLLLLGQWPGWPQRAVRGSRQLNTADRPIAGRFFQRLRSLFDAPGVSVSTPNDPIRPTVPSAWRPESVAVDGAMTADQHEALQAVMALANGAPRQALVLVADRGRGKSAALGLAAGQLLSMGQCTMAATGPGRAALDSVMRHAGPVQEALPYYAPDKLLAAQPRADLLLVDEAAALPLSMLTAMLRRYHRVAFATTVHGYEGTGKGFLQRFSHTLSAQCDHWRQVELHQPIRWSEGDPLEAWLNEALLMQLEPALLPVSASNRVQVEWLDRDVLVSDERLLRQLYGLLLAAHYRTRPSDLLVLLDQPGLSIAVATGQGQLLGAVLIVEEGGFDWPTSAAIWRGERRPRGHLLPQVLIAHLGLAQAGALRAGRVLRIAVHPEARRRGIGSQLLAAARAQAQAKGLAYLGASFAGSQELLRFWRANQWLPARVSLRRNASSGAHSVLMVQGLSPAGQALAATAERRFGSQFPAQRQGPLQALDAGLGDQLLPAQRQPSDQPPSRADWLDVLAVSCAGRVPETAWGALQRVYRQADGEGKSWPADADAALLQRWLFENRSAQEMAQQFGIAGRAALLRRLRETLRRRVLPGCPDTLLDTLETLFDGS